MTTADGLLGGLDLPASGGGPARDLARPDAAPRVRPHGRRRPRLRDAWPLRRLLIALVALLGVGVMLYPSTAAWLSDRAHQGEIASYRSVAAQTDPAAAAAQLAAAQAYNASLPVGRLRDPFTLDTAGEPTEIAGGPATYRDTLDVGAGGMMGVLDIPKIHVDLPIYHGTSDATLAKGVGHLYGSALPVGGDGANAVLTGHSGFASATLFDDLNELVIGDTFSVQVLDQTLTYRVDRIDVVLPEDTASLAPIAGEDHVTLVTCAPIGVNTHRLLVRGTRIPTPAVAAQGGDLASAVVAGFPWWALLLVSAVIVVVLATRPLRRRSGAGPRHSAMAW